MKKEDNFSFMEENIDLVIDSYEDIFSDFDARDHSVKALSDDFLNECRKAANDKIGKIHLKFLISKDKRNYSKH